MLLDAGAKTSLVDGAHRSAVSFALSADRRAFTALLRLRGASIPEALVRLTAAQSQQLARLAAEARRGCHSVSRSRLRQHSDSSTCFGRL